MKTLRHYNKIYLGKNIYNEKIYLDAPSWECGWYWSFGYLGNKNCHYHVDGLKKDGNNNYINLFDGLKKEFRDTFIVKEDGDVWVLAELFETFYTLKKAA